MNGTPAPNGTAESSRQMIYVAHQCDLIEEAMVCMIIVHEKDLYKTYPSEIIGGGLVAHLRHNIIDINLIQRHSSCMKRKPRKSDYLKSVGAWNEKARLVENEIFRQNDFFDPRDKVQAKYEMLRAVYVDDLKISEASRQFGYSRESFYNTADTFREQGIAGLADGKRGPKAPRKLTAKIQQFILDRIDNEPNSSGREIAELIQQELQIEIHHRSVERFIAKRLKKN